MADKVKILNISDITIGERFREDLGDIKGLAESIKEKGIIQPITVNNKMELLAGGRRIAAAVEAGLTKIPALIRDQSEMPDADIDFREVELIENAMRKDFTWDERAKLIQKIDNLCREKNVDWSLRKTSLLLGNDNPMGVSRSLKLANALEAMPELAQCKTQDDAIKFLKKIEEGAVVAELRRRQEETRSEGLRDVIELAKANYRIGDALKEMLTLPSSMNLHLIEVDPPYGIELNEQKKGADDKAQSYKEVPRDEYAAFLKIVATETYRIAGPNCWMIFWFGPTHQHLVLTTLREAGWKVDDIPAIWNKGHGQTMSPENYLARAYEPFFVCKKGTIAMAKRGRSNVFDFKPVPPNKKYHPTERPIELMEEIIETFVGLRSKLFVPFLGSGVTLRAAYNMASSGLGYDLNPEYRDKFLLAVEADTKKLDAEAGAADDDGYDGYEEDDDDE